MISNRLLIDRSTKLCTGTEKPCQCTEHMLMPRCVFEAIAGYWFGAIPGLVLRATFVGRVSKKCCKCRTKVIFYIHCHTSLLIFYFIIRFTAPEASRELMTPALRAHDTFVSANATPIMAGDGTSRVKEKASPRPHRVSLPTS